MDQEQLLYTIALNQLYRNQVRKVRRLLDHYPTAREAWMSTNEERKNECLESAKREMEFVHQHLIQTYYYQDSDYPTRLRQCPDAPVLLYSKGNINLEQGHFLSVVGTRAASERGKDFTRGLILELAERVPDLTIVSGLAYGIDIVAHRAAIEAQIPTIIIPGHGLDRIYPAIHRDIAVRALENGGILTEYPSGTEPDKLNFVARDRIIAGMSDATIVIESRQKGGALITARMAVDYSRSLFAVPGRPSDDIASGCNQLIQSNQAHLLLTAQDVINEMGWQTKEPRQLEVPNLMTDLPQEQQVIMDCLQSDEEGVHINSIVMETGMNYSAVSSALMMMELGGLVRSLPGGLYRALKL